MHSGERVQLGEGSSDSARYSSWHCRMIKTVRDTMRYQGQLPLGGLSQVPSVVASCSSRCCACDSGSPKD